MVDAKGPFDISTEASTADDEPALEGGQLDFDANNMNTKGPSDTSVAASAAETQLDVHYVV